MTPVGADPPSGRGVERNESLVAFTDPWTIVDFSLAWLAGLVGAFVGALIASSGSKATGIVLVLIGQSAGVAGFLVWTARRKRFASLASVPSALPHRALSWFLAGVGLQLVLLLPTALMMELYGTGEEQNVVAVAREARGIQVVLVAAAVVLVAPVIEELLFRGVLVCALLRRMSRSGAVAVSALVFGSAHVLGDPSVGSLVALPAIVILGVVLAVQTVRTGSTARAVMIHMGFNAFSAVALFA